MQDPAAIATTIHNGELTPEVVLMITGIAGLLAKVIHEAFSLGTRGALVTSFLVSAAVEWAWISEYGHGLGAFSIGAAGITILGGVYATFKGAQTAPMAAAISSVRSTVGLPPTPPPNP